MIHISGFTIRTLVRGTKEIGPAETRGLSDVCTSTETFSPEFSEADSRCLEKDGSVGVA